MPRHAVSAATWDKINMTPDRVRGGVVDVHKTHGTRMPVGGAFAVKPQTDDLVRIYRVFGRSGELVLDSYDEDLVGSTAERVLAPVETVPVVTWAVVDNLLFCSSPSFATHYSFLGGDMWEAASVASDDVLLTALAIPRGLCVEWAGRLVIAADDLLYIADPLSPFTFTTLNAMDPPGGSIRGLHSVAGNLVICTTTGVWAMPTEAALSRDVIGAWQHVSEYSCMEYGQTAVTDSVVWGVSRNGLTSVFPAGLDVSVNQDRFPPNTKLTQITARNWRKNGRVVACQRGVALSVPGVGSFIFRPSEQHGSWWVGNRLRFVLAAVVTGSGGEEIFFGDPNDGVAVSPFVVRGNRNEDDGITYGGFAGSTAEHTVDASPVMRRVTVAASGGGATNAFLAVRGNDEDEKEIPVYGVRGGVNLWNDGEPLEHCGRESVELHCRVRSDDHELVVGVDEAGEDISPSLTIEFHGVGRRRAGL